MLTALFTGSRNWGKGYHPRDQRTKVADALLKLPVDMVIVHGNANGLDKMAGEVALAQGKTVIAVPARWEQYGRGAGLIRNLKMLDDWKPGMVIWFHEDLAGSRGTKHMVNAAKQRGIPAFAGELLTAKEISPWTSP